jgi:DNA-directed RNA polymerase subunit F
MVQNARPLLLDQNISDLRGDEMISKRIQEQKPVTLARVKEILSALRKDGELLYEQGIALDHTLKFSRLKVKEAEALTKELVEAGVREDLACKLVDILPQNTKEIHMLFSKERFVTNEEDVNNIMSIIQKYEES